MADVPQAAPAQDRKDGFSFRRSAKKFSVRIDMTPMVDVAFLLLIFFMVTTVFRKPLAMEINMPEPGVEVKVPEENVLTLYVHADNTITYAMGKGEMQTVEWNGLYDLFRQSAEKNPAVIILAKLNRHAKYEDMVEMMDVLEDAGMERFSLVPMTDEDARRFEEQDR